MTSLDVHAYICCLPRLWELLSRHPHATLLEIQDSLAIYSEDTIIDGLRWLERVGVFVKPKGIDTKRVITIPFQRILHTSFPLSTSQVAADNALLRIYYPTGVSKLNQEAFGCLQSPQSVDLHFDRARRLISIIKCQGGHKFRDNSCHPVDPSTYTIPTASFCHSYKINHRQSRWHQAFPIQHLLVVPLDNA